MSDLSESEYKQIEDEFKVFDRDGDGFISYTELRQALHAAGQDYTNKQVHALIKKDPSVPEAKTDGALLSYETAIEAFKLFDSNHSGRITLDELKSAVVKLGIESTEGKVEKIFADLDKDGDGSIDYIEFAVLLGM